MAAPVNGIIKNPGFHTEYSGRDWDKFESRYLPVLTGEELAKLKSDQWEKREELSRLVKDNLWAEKNSGAIILKPNIEPVDMEMRPGGAGNNYFVGPSIVAPGETRDWYKAYGGEWKNITVDGNPKAQVLFQDTVQISAGSGYIACPWRIRTEPIFAENQGVTFWMGKNTLPQNEEDQFTLHLTDGTGKSGIYVEIKSGKALRMAHYIDVPDDVERKKYPVEASQPVQWMVDALPAPKAIYNWPEPYTVYTLFICGRWIFFGVNGVENVIAMECKDYDLNSEGNPIILREKAFLEICGKGQVGIGFKKMVYAVTGRLETPLEFPGYKVTGNDSAPVVKASSFILPAGTDIKLQGYGAGSRKAGGGVQQGPLGDSDANYGVYAAAEFSGKALGKPRNSLAREEFIPINGENMLFAIDYDGFGYAYFPSYNYTAILDTLSPAARTLRNRESYLYRVSEVTPTLFRFKVSDPRTRETVSITSPTPPASGDCLYFNHSWNIDGEGAYLGALSNIGILSKDGLDYQDWLDSYGPDVDVTLQHRAAAAGLKILRHSMEKVEFSVRDFGEHILEMQGYDLVRFLSEQEIKEVRSYDDKNWTYAQLMAELCSIFGVTVTIAPGVGTALLPKASGADSPLWTFTPGTSQWDALNRIRKRAGGILYPDDSNALQWKARPTSVSAANYTLARSSSPVLEPKFWVQNIWRTRIYVIGKAGNSFSGTYGYQKDDKLVGAWYDKTLEAKIGRSREHTEVDDSLSNWESIESRGEQIFAVRTGPGIYFELKIPETLLGAQDCRKVLPAQVLLWQDDLVTRFDNSKFEIIGFSSENDKFTAKATIQGKLLS